MDTNSSEKKSLSSLFLSIRAKFTKKTILLIICTTLSTLCFLSLIYYQYSLIPTFADYNMTLLKEELAQDGLSPHFLLTNLPKQLSASYENHSDKASSLSSSHSLPLYQGIRDNTPSNELSEAIDLVSKIKVSSQQEILDRSILLYHLKQNLALSHYPYLEEPLSPNGGLHVEILLLLSAYPFYETSDITNYLRLLRSFDSFTGSLISYETEKKQHGLFMSSTACKSVISQCEIFSNYKPFSFTSISQVYETLEDPEAQLFFLTESFLQKLLPFYENGLLTESAFLDLLSEHEEILSNTVSPSYEELADTLWLLQDDSIPQKGLCFLPHGKEFYEAKVHSETGSEKSLSEMETLLLDDLATQYRLLNEEIAAYTALAGDLSFMQSFPVVNVNDQLAALKELILSDFPPLSDYMSGEISCDVIPVAKGLCAFTAPAFYIQSPIDYLVSQSIYINYQDTSDALSLFTTLAHEGFPGHLYQHVISSCQYERNQKSYSRILFSNPGFQEGWAVYVEFWAYEHAKNLCTDPLCGDYFHLIARNRRVSLSLYAMTDLLIHEKGADFKEVYQFLSQYGITSTTTAKAIYDYIVTSPANYLKYYMGYLEVLECKELAKSCWKDSYSDASFHRFLLEFGEAPFSIIKEEISKLSSF